MPDVNGFIPWSEVYESNRRVVQFLKHLPAGARLFIENHPEYDIPDAHLAAELLQVTVDCMGHA